MRFSPASAQAICGRPPSLVDSGRTVSSQTGERMNTDGASEASLPITDLLRWVTRADAEALRALVIGCSLDDGTSDDLTPIADISVAERVLVLADGRRVPLRTVTAGAIVDHRTGSPLLAAFAESRTPAEHREAAERAALRRHGVDPDRLASRQDQHAVLTFLRSQQNAADTSVREVEAFHEAMKRTSDIALYRRAAAALRALADACTVRGVRAPVTLPWRLAWFLNRTGQFEDAIAVSETAEARGMLGMNRAYMAAIRASALISLGRIRHDADLLDKAEHAIRIALAAGSEREVVNTLYGVLRAARAQIGVG